MSKLSRTGGNREAITSKLAGDSKARLTCPASAWATRNQAHAAQWLRKHLIHNVKELEVLLMRQKTLTVLRLLTMPSPGTTRPLAKSSSWLSSHSQHQLARWRKWIDSWCAHFVCANKIINSEEKKKQLPIRMTKIRKDWPYKVLKPI